MVNKYLLLLIIFLFSHSLFAQKNLGSPTYFINSVSPTSGSTGTVVTISGGNLTGATSVSFGGVAASSFTVVSASTITAVVGNGATGNVSVVIPGELSLPDNPQFTYITGPPAITSFSPISGPIGTAVTIKGSGFNDTAANNIIYFGAVKATITNANDSTLIVTVPTGTTYQPITVTTGGLTAYSAKPFIVTFNNAQGSNITASSFLRIDFSSTSAEYEVIGDIDGDGKPDIVSTGGGLSVLRNTSVIGSLSFSELDFPQNISLGTAAIADIDGDGKLDIVTVNPSSNSFSVFRNTSTPGNISFAARVDISTDTFPTAIVVGDIDGDGKPDLIIGNSYHYNNSSTTSTISLFKNISSSGSISASSFASKVDFAYLHPYPYWTYPSIVLQDVSGDGKLDIAVGDGNSGISLFRNITSPGNINNSSLSQPVEMNSTGSGNTSGDNLLTGDIDGDGKPDLVSGGDDYYLIDVFRNISKLDSVNDSSFASAVSLNSIYYPSFMALGDIDGDGKPDLGAASDTNGNFYILRNMATPGNINSNSFSTNLIYSAPYKVEFENVNFGSVNICDFDGDGKPDVSFADSSSRIAIFKNQIAGNQPCPTDTWIGGVSTAWENSANWSCGALPDSNTNVIIPSGTVILSSTTTISSITVNPGASFTIESPYNLTIVN